VLERGSLEGEVFPRGGVQALAPEEAQVTTRLAALVRRRLVRPDRAQIAGDDGYRLRQLLVRDAAHDPPPQAVPSVLPRHVACPAGEQEHARKRGAPILCELAGYGASGDAYHITSPMPDGDGAVRAMRQALTDAGLKPEDVTYINAHGTSTPYNDRTETVAVKRLFGDHARNVMLASTKSMTGHLLGAAGALEAAICALVITRGVVPPTINYENPDPECDLDCVPNQARTVPVTAALPNSKGFGGHNGSLAFRAMPKSAV